jgi:molybdenum cofactor cytidylyltransferase
MKEALFAQTSCIILSAGSSERMGTHKALLTFDTEKTFIQKITETYLQAGIKQVFVVVNPELFKLIGESSPALSGQVKLVVNDKPELGRFYSLQTGVKLIPKGNYCFFQNIDNPFTSEEILKELILHKVKADVIIPTFQKKSGHPVLISPAVALEILHTPNPDSRIDLFLKHFKVKQTATPNSNILANINSPEDYTNWLKTFS